MFHVADHGWLKGRMGGGRPPSSPTVALSEVLSPDDEPTVIISGVPSSAAQSGLFSLDKSGPNPIMPPVHGYGV